MMKPCENCDPSFLCYTAPKFCLKPEKAEPFALPTRLDDAPVIAMNDETPQPGGELEARDLMKISKGIANLDGPALPDLIGLTTDQMKALVESVKDPAQRSALVNKLIAKLEREMPDANFVGVGLKADLSLVRLTFGKASDRNAPSVVFSFSEMRQFTRSMIQLTHDWQDRLVAAGLMAAPNDPTKADPSDKP